jgi:hypothetical protein
VRYWIRIAVCDLFIAFDVKRKGRTLGSGSSELPLIAGRNRFYVLPYTPDWRVLECDYTRRFIDGRLDLDAFASINAESVIT